jgi:hypothetical protein
VPLSLWKSYIVMPSASTMTLPRSGVFATLITAGLVAPAAAPPPADFAASSISGVAEVVVPVDVVPPVSVVELPPDSAVVVAPD